MAHNKFDMLCHLLKLLDDERNDIFLHIDLKAKDFPYEEIKKSVNSSKLTIVKRIDVIWGSFAQIECEMELIRSATNNGEYQYLHLLSGLDLPIKSQDEIHNFFDENNGKEFLDLEEQDDNDVHIRSRCRYYWLFQNYNARHTKNNIFKYLEGFSIRLQTFIHIDRIPDKIVIKKGANWFSITGKFAKYLVENEDKINKMFRFSLCADEVFMQTILYNSDFRKNLFISTDGDPVNRRLIDWKRGNPYVFRKEDIDMIKNSNCLFARKFDNDIDSDIISEIDELIERG